METKSNTLNFWPVVLRGMQLRCPNCSRGKLFRSYLKQVDACAECGERFDHIRADDGPAWLTILIVGHLLAPVLLWVIPKSTWPEWVSMTVWISVALVLCLAMLPSAKGFFIGMIWRTNAQR